MEQTRMDIVSVTSGALDLADTITTTKLCRRIIVQGAATAATTVTINGTQVSLAGGVEINSAPIESLSVSAGAGVMCFVISTPLEIFGT